MSKGNNDDLLQQKYVEMVNKFKKDCEESLRGETKAWNELLESGRKNFMNLQQTYAKGHQDLLVNMKKANTDMIEKMEKNYKELRENLQEGFLSLKKQSRTNFDSNVDSFKTTCEDTLRKVPVLPPKVYQDVIKELQNIHGTNQQAIEKAFNEMLTHLDKAFRDTIKQLQLPEVKLMEQADERNDPKKSLPKKR